MTDRRLALAALVLALGFACGSNCPPADKCREHHLSCFDDAHAQCGAQAGDYEACVTRLQAQCDDRFQNCMDCYK